MTPRERPAWFHQVLPSAALGGGSLVGLELAAFLRGRGREVTVWVPGEGATREHARRLGLGPELYAAAALSRRGLVRPLLANWRFGRCLRRTAPGVVHVHSTLAYGAMSWGLR